MMSDSEWLRSLVAGVRRETLVEAAYYTVRQLKQASVPADSRKEHLIDAPGSEPSRDARDLAVRTISAIQEREDTSIERLPHEKLVVYIHQLLSIVREVSAESLQLDPAEGRALLERLRAS